MQCLGCKKLILDWCLTFVDEGLKMTAAECTQSYRHTTNTTVNFQVHPKAGILRERTLQAPRIFLK